MIADRVKAAIRALLKAEEKLPAWESGKDRYWTRLHYYKLLFDKALKDNSRVLDESASILEIGSGSLLGLLPYYAFTFTNLALIEPDFIEYRKEEGFVTSFLRPLYALHSFLMQRNLDFSTYLGRLQSIKVENSSLEEVKPVDHHYDLILSKSFLEYPQDLSRVAAKIKEMSSDKATTIHYLDFSSHYNKKKYNSEFGNFYHGSREGSDEHLLQRGLYNGLNLFRPSEYVKAFSAHFAFIKFYPLQTETIDYKSVHDDWKRFSKEDLEVVNGILIAYN